MKKLPSKVGCFSKIADIFSAAKNSPVYSDSHSFFDVSILVTNL